MQEPKSKKPTEQELEEVKQQVSELKNEVSDKKVAETPTDPAEGLKQKTNAAINNDADSAPQRSLKMVMTVAIGLLILGLVILAVVSRVFLWLVIALILVVVVLSGG